MINQMNFTYNFDLFPEYLEQFKSKLRLAVIYGGDKNKEGSVIYKTHNPRSTKTYQAVAEDLAEALERIGFKSVFVLPDDMTLGEKLHQNQIHLAWLNTGGVQGYNPVCHTPALLEMLGVPYVGHNPLNSSILDNKHSFKRELQGLGFPTAPFMIWHPAQGEFKPHNNLIFQQLFADYSGYFLVKPISGRASLNIKFVEKIDELTQAIAEIQKITHNTVLIEQYLPGREFCISVFGYVFYKNNQFFKQERPFTFSIFERILEPEEKIFTSMDQKAITSERVKLVTEEKLKQELIDLAENIYRNFNLNSLVRIDLRMDQSGKLQILEANPKPDLKRPTANVTSLVAQGLSKYGMIYDDLILSLLSDRLDYLLTYHREIISHIVALL
jgi:D-alanine-D-alanine ligase